MSISRAKRSDTGEWVYGYYVYLRDPSRTRKKAESHRIYTGYAEAEISDDGKGYDFYPDWHEIDHKTLGVSTGFSDKKGNMIFEGDIVAGAASNGLCVVQMFGDTWSATSEKGFTGLLNVQPNLEVRGNIHDNPEFLNKRRINA